VHQIDDNERSISLEQKIGRIVALATRNFTGEEVILPVTLRGVETHGVWIESSRLTERYLKNLQEQVAENIPVFLIPWHQVLFIADVAPGVALDEEAFGLKKGTYEPI